MSVRVFIFFSRPLRLYCTRRIDCKGEGSLPFNQAEVRLNGNDREGKQEAGSYCKSGGQAGH